MVATRLDSLGAIRPDLMVDMRLNSPVLCGWLIVAMQLDLPVLMPESLVATAKLFGELFRVATGNSHYANCCFTCDIPVLR